MIALARLLQRLFPPTPVRISPLVIEGYGRASLCVFAEALADAWGITARGPLSDFQRDFADAAEKLMFEGPKKAEGKRGIIASSDRSEIIFSCLYCGGGHRIVAQNGEVTIERYVV